MVEPASPKEKTIWVKTDIPIVKAYISNDITVAKTHGEVVVKISDSGLIDLILYDNSKSSIKVKLVEVFQNVDGAITSKQSFIYQNAKWESLTLIFYQGGKQLVPFIAMPAQYSDKGGLGTATFIADRCRINCTNGYGSAFIYPTAKIDVTPIKKIIMKATHPASTYGGILGFIMVVPFVDRIIVTMQAAAVASVSGTGNLSLDTSAITGSYFLTFGATITANIDSGYMDILTCSAGT